MMRNPIREKLEQGLPAYGFGVGSGSPVIAESLSHTGIDWVMLDTQHGSWGQTATMLALMAIATGRAAPVARVVRNDYSMIGRLLDEGALGIIVPNVDNGIQAKAAADACRFPPAGTRSWGWGRARNFGADYGARINDEVFLAVQIESAEAVGRAEEILSVPGVDGCYLGPFDLLLSMGLDPTKDASKAELSGAVETVLTACRDTGKIAGIACGSAGEARMRVAQGFRFLSTGYDMNMLLPKAAEILAQLAPEDFPAGGKA
jgi:4-hydroxy-2-oxoheptanedioate aldolase